MREKRRKNDNSGLFGIRLYVQHATSIFFGAAPVTFFAHRSPRSAKLPQQVSSLSFASSPSTLILPLWQQFASLNIQPVPNNPDIVIKRKPVNAVSKHKSDKGRENNTRQSDHYGRNDKNTKDCPLFHEGEKEKK